jgi:hypothetical protein
MKLLKNISDRKYRTTPISIAIKSTRKICIIFDGSSVEIVKKKNFIVRRKFQIKYTNIFISYCVKVTIVFMKTVKLLKSSM